MNATIHNFNADETSPRCFTSFQDSIAVDASGRTAVAEWHAIAAHLLPGRSQLPPTGLVSEIWGLDQITFDDEGKISSILSFRDAFAEERAAEVGTQRFTGADAQTSSMD